MFNFVGVLIYTTLIFKSFCIPEFEIAAKNISNPNTLILSWIKSMLPATMVFMLLFFGVIHAWLSIWAELLKFADRRIYDDWWNSKDLRTFYRKLSASLYQWIHTYIYLDSMRFSNGNLGPRSAKVLTFIICGLGCELLIDVSLRVVYPILFVIIAVPGIIGVSMRVRGTNLYNILIWMMLIMTNGAIMVLYSLEYFVRQEEYVNLVSQYGLAGYLIPVWTQKFT